jgi:hypothetical protein
MRRSLTAVAALILFSTGVAHGDLPILEEGKFIAAPDEPEFMLNQILVKFKPQVSKHEADAFAQSMEATVHEVGRNLGFHRVEFSMLHSPAVGKALYEVGDLDACRQMLSEARAYVYEVIDMYERSGLVEWARPNHIVYANMIPNDPYYVWPTSWPNDASPDQYGVIQMNPEDAWDVTTGENSLIILTDSGLDLDHPDIAANVWTNPGETPGNGVDDDYNGYVDDVHGYDFCGDWTGDLWGSPNEDPDPDVKAGDPSCGDGEDNNSDGYADIGVGHGTMTSGCAGCVFNNSNGFAGVAGGAKVAMARCLSPEGGGTEDMIAAAFEYARAVPADIISCSLGGPLAMPLVQTEIQLAYNAGIPVFIASGNDGSNSPSYPAYYSEACAVGGVNHDDSGKTSITTYGNWLDCCAASGDVVGETLTELVWSIYVASVADANADPGLNPGDPMLAGGAGTSLAAPYVAGLAALIHSVEPGFTAAQIYDQIWNNCYDVPPTGYDIETGYGRADVGMAMEDWISSAIGDGLPIVAVPFSSMPNPFTREISFNLGAAQLAGANAVEIFDLNGRIVRRLETSGPICTWDGKDSDGSPASSGIYFARTTGSSGTGEPMKIVKIN